MEDDMLTIIISIEGKEMIQQPSLGLDAFETYQFNRLTVMRQHTYRQRLQLYI